MDFGHAMIAQLLCDVQKFVFIKIWMRENITSFYKIGITMENP